DCDLLSILTAPDFPGGGQLIYNADELRKIYETGRGGFKVRAVYSYDKSANCIDITEIPPTATVEAIIEKTVDLVKQKRLSEISDIRDETGLKGLKITIDMKRGTDPDKLMAKLFKLTALQDTFSCNFNFLVAGSPKVMGIREILEEWTAFRAECVRRRVYHTLEKAESKLHLLLGLQKILLDIDKAIKIVRETEDETEVVPNLMIGFGIDEIQAEYVAEIKLRHLNREYILKRLDEIEKLKAEIEDMRDILDRPARVYTIMTEELKEVIKKYRQPRRTQLIYAAPEPEVLEEVPDYPVTLFFTRHGYFKKITAQSLRMSGEQKLKEGDEIAQTAETANNRELLFFTDKCQVYKTRAADFADSKASVLGDYLPGVLEMEPGETPVYMAVTGDYTGYMLFFFENGKVAKVDMKSYATKTNRKKLIGAYSDISPLISAFYLPEDGEFLLKSTLGRLLLLHTGAVAAKVARGTQGVTVMILKRGNKLAEVLPYTDGMLLKPHRYRTRTLPAVGSTMSAEEVGEQLQLTIDN
ncbi:MAG: topoisomerase IV, partial [Oscillospiraceae bacterium]|nr:topoisomerase IV [Oscillospiraceae bacterium]